MAANSGSGRAGSRFGLSVRQIVIAGILGGIAIFLGYTRLGFIPVPNLAGSATIMHVPAILGGALEGPVVGTIVGAIFGIFSFIQADVPFFRDPLVSILPRLFIGVVAWAVFVGLRRWSVDVAAAAAPRATRGSRARLYLSSMGWSGATGHGVRRLVGMWVCSGSHRLSKPRASQARASSTIPMETSVGKMVTPWRIRRF